MMLVQQQATMCHKTARTRFLAIVLSLFAIGQLVRPSSAAESTDAISALLALTGEWGATDSKWDLNGDGIVNVDDLLILIANWHEYNEPKPTGVGSFIRMPEEYVNGSGVNLELQMHADAPAYPHVVFQVWSLETNSIEAPYTDWTPPFTYPASYLNQVTLGGAEIQALVRNEMYQVVEIIRAETTFVTEDNNGGDPKGKTVVPVITVMDDQGMAPFSVHVHALDSDLGAGDILTARYVWDFDDPSGDYNRLEGWNAAHTYNIPGTYTVQLTVTNENGEAAVSSHDVTVTTDSRNKIYISASGNDFNPGTQTQPVRSVSRAQELLDDNTTLLFRRGGTYSLNTPLVIPNQNVHIRSYGSGSKPVLMWNGGEEVYDPIIRMFSSQPARQLVIENMKFDSPYTVSRAIVRAIHPVGTNITIRDCVFGNVSYGVDSAGGVDGFIMQDNDAPRIGDKFSWAVGNDHAYLGNTATSGFSHVIRFGQASRVLIAHNDLTSEQKRTIWTMLGSHAYITQNRLRKGPAMIGPNETSGHPNERFPWVVFERNHVTDNEIRLEPGAEHLMIRNNVIENGGVIIRSAGWLDWANRTVDDVRIINNTAINMNDRYGQFLWMGGGTKRHHVANNLYFAPFLNEDQVGGAHNVRGGDAHLNTHLFARNLWSIPLSGDTVHTLPSGPQTQASWSQLSETHVEQYRLFGVDDLSPSFVPAFPANISEAAPGVHTDYNGNPRSVSGIVTAGAIQIP